VFGTSTLKVALTTNSYTPNIDTDEVFSDVTNELPTAGGYTAGGQTLTSVTWTYDSANNRMQLDCADPSWSAATFTCRRAVFYKSTGTSSTSPLLSWQDFGADQSPAGVTFNLVVDSTGILRIASV
jgi:hypothetical protein